MTNTVEQPVKTLSEFLQTVKRFTGKKHALCEMGRHKWLQQARVKKDGKLPPRTRTCKRCPASKTADTPVTKQTPQGKKVALTLDYHEEVTVLIEDVLEAQLNNNKLEECGLMRSKLTMKTTLFFGVLLEIALLSFGKIVTYLPLETWKDTRPFIIISLIFCLASGSIIVRFIELVRE